MEVFFYFYTYLNRFCKALRDKNRTPCDENSTVRDENRTPCDENKPFT